MPTPPSTADDRPVDRPAAGGLPVAAGLPGARFWALFGLAAMIVGGASAVWRAWLTDDAFISFRYARNLIRGHGLVYNIGERVEGYTNYLWTMWSALGLELGVSAEVWSQIWGVACFVGCLALLALISHRAHSVGAAALGVPVAALFGALHPDWVIYATGGLETSLFTLLVLAGYVLLIWGRAGECRRPMVAGLVLALATLTRPDGVLFLAIGVLYVAWTAERRWRSTALYVLMAAALLAPYMAWRLTYFGEFWPNTFYAKSAQLAWWDQGWHYVRLFFTRYWMLLPAFLVLPVWLALPMRAYAALGGRRTLQMALLATAFAVVYTLYVMRVGGCFMFARLLVPTVPFYLLLIELALAQVALVHRGLAMLFAVALPILMAGSLPPVSATERPYGIADEWAYYNDGLLAQQDRLAEVLDHYFEDLPVTVAFLGAEARVMYKGDVPVAIESTTGLTDRVIARQPLAERGWVGHEKPAPLDYLIGERRAHFAFSARAPEFLGLDQRIPQARIGLDEFEGFILHWDPELMAELERRGADVPDFEQQLDVLVEGLDGLDRGQIERAYDGLRLFYFDRVDDPVREQPIRAFLGLPAER